MATLAEIQAARDALKTQVAAGEQALKDIEAAVAGAKRYSDLADSIESGGRAVIGAKQGDRLPITDPAALAKLVAYLRAEAKAELDAVTLPA